jgi:hypothetical protein
MIDLDGHNVCWRGFSRDEGIEGFVAASGAPVLCPRGDLFPNGDSEDNDRSQHSLGQQGAGSAQAGLAAMVPDLRPSPTHGAKFIAERRALRVAHGDHHKKRRRRIRGLELEK